MNERGTLAEAAEQLSKCELVKEVVLYSDAENARPWAVVQPDYSTLRSRCFGNIFEAVRFRVETGACQLPVAQRPRGMTLLPEGSAQPITDSELRIAIGEGRRLVTMEHSLVTELSAEWRAVFVRALPDDAKRCRLHARTSLEFDLELDSLDRLAFLFSIASQLGAVVGNEDALNAALTLGEVIDFFGDRSVENQVEGALVGPAAFFSFRAKPTPPHFLRPASATWPIVSAVRALSRVWAHRRLEFDVIGLDRVEWRRRPMIVAQNHQSVIDPPLLAAALPTPVHRRLIFLGFTGYFSHGLGQLASRLFRVHPCSADAGLARGFRAGARALNAGMTVGLYPEGERTWDGSLRPFKRGVAWLARETGATVVPSAIVGAYEAWPRGWPFQPHPVRVAFGPPLAAPTRDSGAAEERAFIAALRSQIAALMIELGADPQNGAPAVWAFGPSAAPRKMTGGK